MFRNRSLSALLPVLLLSVAIVLSALTIARAFVKTRSSDDGIRVIGSARKPIRSDFIIWKGRVTQTAPTVTVAYAQLKTNIGKVENYLRSKGVPQTEIIPNAVNIKTLYAKVAGETYSPSDDDSSAGFYRPIQGYQLSQEIEVRSSNVPLVDGISRQSTELISSGVPFSSAAPMYLYTKLSDLKVTMQAEAARDALARAEQIATNSGCRLGAVRYARMSAPAITPLYSTSESDGGVDDTSSLDKKITAVVVVSYAAE